MKEIYLDTGPLASSIMSKSPRALYNIVRGKAAQYMSLYPGPDNVGCNTNCYLRFYRLVEGAPADFDDLYHLNEILDYRRSLISVAEFYCYHLEIGIPKGRLLDQFDKTEW